jgi:glycerophosphoryl diester phosphodiesterase
VTGLTRHACEGDPVRVLGHRGSCQPGPENTLSAVRAALDAGADGVEVDIRRTADDQLVLCHDPTFRAIPVIARPYAPELGLPLVSDLLDTAGGRGWLVLEVKNRHGEPDFDGTTESTAGLVAALLAQLPAPVPAQHAPPEVTVSSFDWRAVDLVRHRLGDQVRTALLVPPVMPVGRAAGHAVRLGHPEVHVPLRTVLTRPGRVARLHGEGLTVVVWTVRTTQEALRLRDGGVDAVICDDPAAVVAALRG